MSLSYITLAVALSLSAIAAYYSIAGLTAIFAAAVIPIIVMGGILEIAKIVVTVWLHEYWARCKWAMKTYLSLAVVILMFITSMGIFGFLSKAHSDQSLVSGDVQSKIAIYDEKIKTEKENIEANRWALKQMDAGVDQVLGRSTDEKGAEKAVAIRRSQQKERTRLQKEISQSQQSIAQLNEARAPIAAEVRKVEAEVGPIKYIAALVYGDNPDANLLERAVRWVIIMLVIVFDPLAIMMLLAATESLKWDRSAPKHLPEYPQDDGPLSDDQLTQIQEGAPAPKEKSLREQHPYLFEPFVHFTNLKPMVAKPDKNTINDFVAQPQILVVEDSDPIDHDEHADVKQAMKLWKEQNPGSTLKEQRHLFARGEITELPWMHLVQAVPDNQAQVGSMIGFGSTWPVSAVKGDTFVRIDSVPSILYKFNGDKWIRIDKNLSDQYAYDNRYIQYLIDKIAKGEYDPDLLSTAEQEQISQTLQHQEINKI